MTNIAETSPITDLQVHDATLIPLVTGEGIQLLVVASGLIERASPLIARVGEQSVKWIHQSKTGFSGILDDRPRDGDRLYVGYLDIGLQSTHIIFGPIPVA